MSKIVSIQTGKSLPVDLEPNDEAIALLKDLLAMAESGVLQAVVVVGVTQGREVLSGYSLDSNAVSPYLVIGGLEAAKLEVYDICADR